MRFTFASVVVLCVLFSSTRPGGAQADALRTHRLTESEARAIAMVTAAQAIGNVEKFERLFREAVRARIPDYDGRGKPVTTGTLSLRAELMGQLTTFERNVVAQLRSFRPASGAAWPPGATLVLRIDDDEAPDVERVQLRVNGVVHDALENRLVTGLPHPKGGIFKQRSGSLSFDPDLFAPGPGTIYLVLTTANNRTYVGLARGSARLQAWRD